MDRAEAYTGVVDIRKFIQSEHSFATNQKTLWAMSDEMLAARIVQGDVTALEILYDRYAAMILGMALKITGNQALAENLLQETFWQVWQNVNSYQSENGSFTGWLFRMARSLAMEKACEQQS
jgi:RNA polymerase sigma-70 factor (ECF subfamily)